MSRGAGAPLRSRGPCTAHLQIVANDTPEQPPENPPLDEPTDEELWLEEIARQVEADARPLFAHALAYLFHRALELDENEEPA